MIIHFNESFLSDEGSSENVFLKYNVFNAFDAVPYYNVTPENIQRLAYITEEMETESRNINTFAHKDYLKYLVKMFLIYIQRIGQREQASHCVSTIRPIVLLFSSVKHWSTTTDTYTQLKNMPII